MKFAEVSTAEAEGAILAHSVNAGGVRFKKGTVLGAGDVSKLVTAGVETVFAARPDPGDEPEDEAAARLARAISGGGLVRQEASTGRANIYAAKAGVVKVEAKRVRALNRLHEAVTFATLPPYQTVAEGQMVATVKIIPFAAPRQVVDDAISLAEAGPLVSLAPFSPHEAGLVLTQVTGGKQSLIDKSQAATAARLEALGSSLGGVVTVVHTVDGVAEGIGQMRDAGHSPILVFGASAIVDRADVVPAGLERAGGEIIHLGMPVDPGNLLLLGTLSGTPVIGVPSCARSPKPNGFDWVLARVLAGIEVGPHDIMDMGAGGLLMEIPSRPSPREADR